MAINNDFIMVQAYANLLSGIVTLTESFEAKHNYYVSKNKSTLASNLIPVISLLRKLINEHVEYVHNNKTISEYINQLVFELEHITVLKKQLENPLPNSEQGSTSE